MTEWNQKLETLIRKFAAYQDKQMRDAVNPKASAIASGLRMAFRAVAGGRSSYEKACQAAGLEASFDNAVFEKNIQQMIDLAAQNGSNAADKLKKALPVGQQLAKDFSAHPDDFLQNIKIAKQKNIKY